MDHHDFSPSRLEQFRLCPGSYYMQQGLKENTSEWAEEGILLHKAVETEDLSILKTDEQKTVAESCIDFVRRISSGATMIFKEERVDIKDTNGDLLTYGFLDIGFIKDNELTIIDFKFGYNLVKEVSRNIQLATYAVGAMQKYGFSKCKAIVFQPRIFQQSEYVFSNASAIIQNIRTIINNAKNTNLVLNASEDACRYCRARLNCPAFRLKFQKLNACRDRYDLKDIQTLVSLYDASKEVKSFINEVEAAVKKVIEEQGRCGKYVFQTTEGSREIKDLNALYSVVKDYLTTQEFTAVCKLTLGKFETALADKLIAEAAIKGEKITKTQAKARCYSLIAPLITRGNPTKKIVEEVA